MSDTPNVSSGTEPGETAFGYSSVTITHGLPAAWDNKPDGRPVVHIKDLPQPTEDKPPHPLVTDRETKKFRYATHADIRRWEMMELRYNNLLATLRGAINGE